MRTERPGLKDPPAFADEVLILRRLPEGQFLGFPTVRRGDLPDRLYRVIRSNRLTW